MDEQRAEAEERRTEAAAEEEAPVAEPEDAAAEEAAGTQPEDELERAQRERDEYLDMAQRARAELENFRKRVRAETAGAEQRGRAAVARDLIPALDNLERALTAAGVDPAGTPQGEPASEEVSAHTALAEGVALVYRELCAGIERAGVVAFDPLGERFDPALHEVVATTERDGAEPGLVLETLEKGYRVGDQVLRPARVVVSG
jgi:molecular chaperone GrpE